MLNTDSLKNKRILIIGGTGTFGQAFTQYVLSKVPSCHIVIYSRDEYKQCLMKQSFSSYIQKGSLSFVIGYIRDVTRLKCTCNNIDYIVHVAAQKQVRGCGQLSNLQLSRQNNR